MRLPLAALVVAVLLPASALAEEPPRLVVPVGGKVTIGGYAGMCDDLSIATITLDANATITGLKVGTTICSSRLTGGRQVYRVEVREPTPAAPPEPAPGKKGRAPEGKA